MSASASASRMTSLTASPGTAAAGHRSLPRLLLLLLLLVGIHTRLTIYYNGNVLVPMYLCLGPATLFTVAYRDRITAQIVTTFVALSLFIVIASSITFYTLGVAQSQIRGGLQLLSSLFLGLGIYFVLDTTDQSLLRRAGLVMWVIIVVLATIELTTSFRTFVVSVVDYLYKGTPRFIYDAADRDVDIYGHVRPLLFASEPSFLATTLSLLVFLVFVCDLAGRPLISMLRAVVMLAVSYLVAPSLTFAFTAVVISFWFLSRMAGSSRLTPAVLIGVPVVVLIFVLGTANPLIGEALEHSRTGSFFGRVIAPPLSATNVLAYHPLFGVGLGNEDSAYPMIFAAWSAAGAFSRFPWFASESAAGLVTNPFWWHWIYFGLIGGSGFLYILWRLLGAIGAHHRFLILVSTAVFWSAGFGYVDLVSWSIFYLFAFADRFLPPVHATEECSALPSSFRDIEVVSRDDVANTLGEGASTKRSDCRA